ncbi:2-oxoacid:acceptor oxidoreductase subunit alpha, partial [archaeon]|nr:2-oxoacid:acceptor oxidoreductase subunit alpha [archaeon]
KPQVFPPDYKPYEADESMVPPMACFGEGYRFYSTGLTHNEMGYPDMSVETQDKLVRRLCDKIRRNKKKITMTEETMTEDCDVLVVAYGVTARSAASAVQMARSEGIKAGLLRLITLWPFPDWKIEEVADNVKGVVIPEMNYGQLVREVERSVKPTPVEFIPKLGENPPSPDEILEKIRRLAK